MEDYNAGSTSKCIHIQKKNRSRNKDASPSNSGNTYARPVPYISIADLFANVNTLIGESPPPKRTYLLNPTKHSNAFSPKLIFSAQT